MWDSTGAYDLDPVKLGGRIYYSKSGLIRHFLQSDDMHLLDEPLLTRIQAAGYLGRTGGTLAVWDCLKSRDLRPIKVGASVRYSRLYLDHFLNLQLQPKLLITNTTAKEFRQ